MMYFPMFTIIPLIFFVLVAIMIGTVVVKGLKRKAYNDSQPQLTVQAQAVAKRTRVSGGGRNTHARTYYYITFEFDTSSRHELQVEGDVYGMVIEGDRGRLTFQGDRFFAFDRELVL